MATSALVTGSTYTVIDGTSYSNQNSGAGYAIEAVGSDALRFEVDAGDTWALDPSTVNRSEIASGTKIANGTSIDISYNLKVDSFVSTDPTSWAVLGQLHQDDAAGTPKNSPPYALSLVGGVMTISIGYTGPDGVDTSKAIWSDTAAVTLGENYAISVSATFAPDGEGQLSVVRNGITIVTYTGPLGYDSQSSVYWKEGIYQSASVTTTVAEFSDLSVTTSVAAPITSAKPAALVSAVAVTAGKQIFSTYRDFDASSGALDSTTILYADGSTSKNIYQSGHLVETDNVSSSQTEIYTYNQAGTKLSYTLKAANGYQYVTNYTASANYAYSTSTYNASGALVSLIQYRSNATVYSSSTFNSDGSKSISTYNAQSQLVSTSYTSTNGSKQVNNYIITGQAYTSEKLLYDQSGNLTLLQRYLPSGAIQFDHLYGTAGVSHYYIYDSQGNLTQKTTTSASGAVSKSDYAAGGVLLQLRLYDTTGMETMINRYDAAGNVLFSESLKSDGSTASTTYDSAGHVLQSIVTAPGSSYTTNYSASGVVTSKIAVAADGSRIEQHYGLTGGYTSDRVAYSANGAVLSLQRYDAAGHLIFYQTFGTAASSTFNIYSQAGVLTQKTVVASDKSMVKYDYNSSGGVIQQRNYDTLGSIVTATKYNDAGSITSSAAYNLDGSMSTNTVYNIDGSKTVDRYSSASTHYLLTESVYAANGTQTSNSTYNANGTLSSSLVNKAGGTVVATAYDTTGKFVHSTTTYADGSRDYLQTEVPASGLVSTFTHYDKLGNIAQITQVAVDGSSRSDTYGIIGQVYSSELISYNAAGVETSSLRRYSSGTVEAYETMAADGTKQLYTYDQSGNKTTSTAFSAAGSAVTTAYAANLTLNASGNGGDILTSYHNDTFAFYGNVGKETVVNFHGGDTSTHDVIKLSSALVSDYQHLSLTQSGSDTLLTVSANDVITLKNVQASALTSNNFMFS